MGAQFRHKSSLRRAGQVRVTVHANDGRMIDEEFLAEPAELVRFAWAILADYAPAEARRAAREDGVDLVKATAAAPLQMRKSLISLPPSTSGVQPGSDPHRLLAWIGAREVTVRQIETEAPYRPRGWTHPLRVLVDAGWVEKTRSFKSANLGWAGVYARTDLGREALKRLDAEAAQRAEAA
ncbi:MAG: hypothetical protein JSR98_15240 [Proteobacteria bacterium]|nr:hypothetical protein [Pseudomonadota bacterium]